MLCGSCIGAVTWSARMMQLANGYKASALSSSGNLVHASASLALLYHWRAVFTVAYAAEFLCLTTAKLMVLQRMPTLSFVH